MDPPSDILHGPQGKLALCSRARRIIAVMRARAALTALVALALGGGAAATERAPFPTVDASGALLERRALVALANATNWQAWQQPWPLQRWRQEDPCGNGWAGVFCAPNGRVRRLCGPQPLQSAQTSPLRGKGGPCSHRALRPRSHLPAQGLSGPLHPALGQLSFLRELCAPPHPATRRIAR